MELCRSRREIGWAGTPGANPSLLVLNIVHLRLLCSPRIVCICVLNSTLSNTFRDTLHTTLSAYSPLHPHEKSVERSDRRNPDAVQDCHRQGHGPERLSLRPNRHQSRQTPQWLSRKQ